MDRVYEAAVNRGVAVVPGKYFFADPERGGNTLRLNFSMPDVLSIRHAVAILTELLRDHVGITTRGTRIGKSLNPYPRLVPNVITQLGSDFNGSAHDIAMSQAFVVRKF